MLRDQLLLNTYVIYIRNEIINEFIFVSVKKASSPLLSYPLFGVTYIRIYASPSTLTEPRSLVLLLRHPHQICCRHHFTPRHTAKERITCQIQYDLVNAIYDHNKKIVDPGSATISIFPVLILQEIRRLEFMAQQRYGLLFCHELGGGSSVPSCPFLP